LEVWGAIEPGSTVELNVTGASPQEMVYFVAGRNRQPGAACPPVLGGLCVDVGTPMVIGQARANAQGGASLSLTAPRSPNGTQVYFQATATAPGATSNVVAKFNPYSTFQAPTGLGRTSLSRREEATVTQRNGYQGSRTDAWSSAVPNLESCIYDAAVSGRSRGQLPACPGCDFAFQVTVGPFTELQSAGDCAAVLGIDLPNTPSFVTGIAFHASYTVPQYGQQPVAMMIDPTTGTWRASAPATFDPATSIFTWEAVSAARYTY
jgi:hypothetical protein